MENQNILNIYLHIKSLTYILNLQKKIHCLLKYEIYSSAKNFVHKGEASRYNYF